MEPVGLGVKTQDPMQTIGSVMNIAGSAQNLQRGNVALNTEQMILREKQAVQQFMSNPQNYMNERGEIDSAKFLPAIRKIAPLIGDTIAGQAFEAQHKGTEARRVLNTAGEEERGMVGKVFNSLVGQPYNVAIERLEAEKKRNGNLAPAIDTFKQFYLDPYKDNQQALDKAYMAIGRSVQPVSEQQGAVQGSYQVLGNTAQQVSPTARAAGQQPDSMAVTMAPGNLETIEQDAVGNKFVVSRSPQGTILSSRPMPAAGAQSQGAGPQSSFNMPPGDREAVPVFTAERQKINDAAKVARTSRFNNSEILRLADETSTGKAAEILQKIGGGYATLPWTSDSATNFNRLGHYIALEAVNASNAMGIGGTDAGRALAQQATLDTGWTKDAIKSAVKINDALSSGILKYNEGMEKAIAGQGGNVLAARDFKNKWTQNFDLNLFRYANALERKDQDEISAILGKPGTPERASKARELAAKSARLNQLVTTGQ